MQGLPHSKMQVGLDWQLNWFSTLLKIQKEPCVAKAPNFIGGGTPHRKNVYWDERGGHSTYSVDVGNNWGGDTAQHWNLYGQVGGLVGWWVIPSGNNATSWLHIASWNLLHYQLSWESKMEPSVAIVNLNWIISSSYIGLVFLIFCTFSQCIDHKRLLKMETIIYKCTRSQVSDFILRLVVLVQTM